MNSINVKVHSLKKELSRILHYPEDDNNLDFLISSLTEYNPFYTTKEIKRWLEDFNKEQLFKVEQIPLTSLSNWSFNDKTGDLKHDSGGFFQIRGLKVSTNWGEVSSWTQPIIYQPEIGILGIITKKIDGILYFLMQAKAEPGNINTHQLSPTVQATKSNYTRIHGGKPTVFLEYFSDTSKSYVYLDQLQSEQGARFYQKRNRNIIIRIPNNEEISFNENFRWLTLGQINQLIKLNNVVNMDSRSVLSNISFDSDNLLSIKVPDKKLLKQCILNFDLCSNVFSEKMIEFIYSHHRNSYSFNSISVILNKITREKFNCELETHLLPLNKVNHWIHTENEICHPEKKYFSVIGVRVESVQREVNTWDQPIIKQDYPGIVGFITKIIEGNLHILTQLKMESGVMDLLEISPTVQCITSNYTENDMPLFVDELLNRKKFKTVIDVFQSEEGGRFYKESNQNIVLFSDDSFPLEEPPGYLWMTLSQIKHLIRFNNLVNVEARSLLTCFGAA